MLSKLTVSQALATSAGLSTYEVETACDELTAAELVEGKQWSAYDAAVLFLRLTAPHVPIDRFDSEIANATLSGAAVSDVILADQKGLLECPYTAGLYRHSATTLLEQHLSSLEAGKSEQTDMYEISHIAVCSSEYGYCLSLYANWDATGNAPSSVTYLFGDASVFLTGGRTTSIPTLALSALGDALRRSHKHSDQQPTGLGAHGSLLMPGSLLVH